MGESPESLSWGRCLGGDRRAFGEIFDLHHRRLFRVALRSAPSASDAEDLVAASYLELWRRREDVPLVDGSVLPWLLVAINNLGRNAARSRRRYGRFLDALPPRDDRDPALDRVEELDSDRETMKTLRQLPRQDAEILALIALDGLTTSEAAAALGITDDAARARLSRARRRARVRLRPAPDGTPEGSTT